MPKVTVQSDMPPFVMRHERGKLVPATQYDAERLDTFRANKELNCYLVQEPSSGMVRKWWAVIGLAVAQCNTPWNTPLEASDALKIELGHCTTFKTVHGKWNRAPRSLNELNHSELVNLFDRAMIVLEQITGVDPLTLQKEAPSTEPPPVTHLQAELDAADRGEEVAPASPPEEDGVVAAASSSEEMVRCCRDFLKWATLANASQERRRDLLIKVKGTWKDNLTEADLEQAARLYNAAYAVIKGEIDLDDAISSCAMMLGCEPEDIRKGMSS